MIMRNRRLWEDLFSDQYNSMKNVHDQKGASQGTDSAKMVADSQTSVMERNIAIFSPCRRSVGALLGFSTRIGTREFEVTKLLPTIIPVPPLAETSESTIPTEQPKRKPPLHKPTGPPGCGAVSEYSPVPLSHKPGVSDPVSCREFRGGNAALQS